MAEQQVETEEKTLVERVAGHIGWRGDGVGKEEAFEDAHAIVNEVADALYDRGSGMMSEYARNYYQAAAAWLREQAEEAP